MGQMESFIFLIALSGAVSQTAVAPTGNMFNCLRQGVTCAAGACNETGGGWTCDCLDGFKQHLDYHCIAANANLCNIPCENGGVCLNDGMYADRCICTQMYTGINCETPRIEVVCNADNMTVYVRPHGAFTGAMYAKGMAGNVDCLLQGSAQDPLEFSKDFAYNESSPHNCGLNMTDLYDASNNVMGFLAEVSVIVQYLSSPDILTQVDQELRATCRSDNVVAGVIFQTDVTSSLQEATGQARGSPLQFTFLDESNSKLAEGATVTVGSLLTIRIQLHDNPFFEEFTIDECTVSNMANTTAPDYVSFSLVETGGCPAGLSIIRGRVAASRGPEVGVVSEWRLNVSAFMFVKGNRQSSSMLVSCKAKLCASVDSPLCQPASCDIGKRRRRSADTETLLVGQTLTVRFGNSSLSENYQGGADSGRVGTDTTTESCLTSPGLQTLVSLLALLLFIALLALVVIAYLLFRRSRRHDKDDVTSTSTSTPRMHIPRPRV